METFNILGEKLFQLNGRKRYFADRRSIIFKTVTVTRHHEFVERNVPHLYCEAISSKEEPKSFSIKAPVNTERSCMDELCNGDTGG
jgi:hypothetical protein